MGFFGKIFGGKSSEEAGTAKKASPEWNGPKRGFCKFEVRGSYQIPGIGTVVVGMVAEGILKPGLSFNVGEKTGKVLGIERRRANVAEAASGQLVSITVEGIAKQDMSPGDLLEFY
jgi:translation elongation factor EF-1alpha